MQTWLQNTQRQLSKQIQTSKLPHGLLLSGVTGSGYQELSLWLVQVLLCQNYHADELNILQPCSQCKTCKLFVSYNYPDHITVSTDKSTIGVEEVRKLSQFFEKTAHIGHLKTALIIQADLMTISAANALLKTLEEPTPNSFIILTTECAETLLPTVISRCQQIKIRPPVGEKLLAEYKTTNEQGFALKQSSEKSDLFTNLSHYPELSNETVANDFSLFHDNVIQYLCYHQQRAEVLKTLVDSRDGMRWFEKVIVDIMRQQWHWDTAKPNSREMNIGAEKIWQIHRLLQTANMKLKTLVQINRQFLSEKLLVDISQVINEAEE